MMASFAARTATLLLGVVVEATVFSNVAPVLDMDGRIVQAKDGNVLWHAGKWWMFGMSYGLCDEPPGPNGCANTSVGACGFRLDHNISLYSSSTMGSGTWRMEAQNVLPIHARPSGVYFAPKVRWHGARQRFVLWVNFLFEPGTYGFSRSQYLAATAPSPQGPFVVRSANASVLQLPGGDFDLFTEGDDAYLIYTSHLTAAQGAHRVSVELLGPDWLGTSGRSSGYFGASNVEAPVMFQRGGVYYALFDHCCCFCGGGSGAVVHTASKPLGPWTTWKQIGAYANGSSIPKAQQRSILRYPHPRGLITPARTDEPLLLWQGNRWQSAPDGKKDHDFATWLPLAFDQATASKPALPVQLVWQDEFKI
jgi:hypothetical protein